MSAQALRMLAEVTQTPLEDLAQTARRYPFALPSFLRRRVEEGSYSRAALRQFLPDRRELLDIAGFTPDPTGESGLHPERGILQAYHNRAAIIVTYHCLVYCRFCFRKNVVGFDENKVPSEDLDRALAYVESHPEINDILLSGGDPLAMPNSRLIPFLERLVSIDHVRAVRIDSRALNAHPQRLDDELLAFLESKDRFWYYAHLNHPDDLDHPEVLAAVRRLLAARVPVMNQCVFLAGVNDNVATMSRLMELCYFNKVLPYNLYVLDRVKGGAHFEVPDEKVLEIYRALAGLGGPAQPLLVYVGGDSRKRRAINSEWMDLESFLDSRHADHP